ncbi:ABC transporter family substrate-binding protein [Actinomadura harenae]|uniref:ABC transporter family substrate-binding protein n=1 Tax=Actinomadura harenae TaxID=2483351 RepID=A0A3M2MC93_9ACTN|nr:ABC transporter family substrate-binding protein [Actinomadura harenae]
MILRPWSALALAVASVCAATGCSVPDASSSMASTRSGQPPAYDVNPQPRDRVRFGGTLRWPLPEFPAQFNFHHVNGGKGTVALVLQGILPFLMRADEKAVPHPVPEFLESARVTMTKPRQVVTYRINPHAHWSNGKPIGYADFAAQARALSGRDPRFQVATVTGYREITKVQRGTDDREVKVAFDRPYADWRSLFSPLYPAATSRNPRVFNDGWVNRVPVTAGPFRVRRIDETAKTVELVRDPGWWGRPAKLDGIVFRALDPGAMPGAFANGEVDLMDVGTDPAGLRRAAEVRGARIRRAGGPDWRHLTFNAASPLLSDVRVRRALFMAVDRDVIVRSDLAGLGRPPRPLGNHFYVNTQAGYRDDSGDLGRYDPERAGRLLDAAGWIRHGRAYRVKNGRTLALRFVVPSGVATSRREGELTRALLARVGVRVDIVPVPTDDLFDQYVTPGNFDIVPFSWLGTAFPLSPLRSVFARPQGDHIQQNYSRVGSAQIDTAMDRAIAEVEPARARRLINAADKLVWQEATVLPLYQRPQVVAVRAGLANLGACGFWEPAFEDIGFSGDA